MIGSNPKPHLLFLVVLVVGLFSCLVQSMRFDLQTGVTRCIAEDIKKNSMTVGNYSIVNPNEGQPLPSDHTITVQVYWSIYSLFEREKKSIFFVPVVQILGHLTNGSEDYDPFMLINIRGNNVVEYLDL